MNKKQRLYVSTMLNAYQMREAGMDEMAEQTEAIAHDLLDGLSAEEREEAREELLEATLHERNAARAMVEPEDASLRIEQSLQRSMERQRVQREVERREAEWRFAQRVEKGGRLL